MFGETENQDWALRRPYRKDRRKDDRRSRNAPPWQGDERRATAERRLDADWRFAVIRRRMSTV